ncbi:MAG: AAA family ATPase [Chloroflexi bacterium]|nr:AAA family ATPase [Chloroflexota bacterium]
MYCTYFKLRENPFTTSPKTRFFYLAPSHAESMAKCEYAIRNKSGLAVVYGDVGTGKTTILNKLRERFGDDNFTIAVLNNPNQTSDTALLKAIATEFGLQPPRTKRGAYDHLQKFLAREVIKGRTPLLLLDEAQDLKNSIRADRDMLGMLKTLTNLMIDNERLIQIILFGQLELIPLLKNRRELMSRVAQFGVLSPLTIKDAKAMIEHRWKTAGGKQALPIEKKALDQIYQATKGLPRDIVKVCNSALTYVYARRLKVANIESARYAIAEHHLQGEEENVQ